MSKFDNTQIPLHQEIRRGDPLECTSEPSETFSLGDNAVFAAASTSAVTIDFLFCESDFDSSSSSCSLFSLFRSIAWASSTIEASSSAAYSILFIASIPCEKTNLNHLLLKIQKKKNSEEEEEEVEKEEEESLVYLTWSKSGRGFQCLWASRSRNLSLSRGYPLLVSVQWSAWWWIDDDDDDDDQVRVCFSFWGFVLKICVPVARMQMYRWLCSWQEEEGVLSWESVCQLFESYEI